MSLTEVQLRQFSDLSQDIGSWAYNNFGQNAGKPAWLSDPMVVGHSILLGPYAPLIGIGEEIGEMTAAIFEQNMEEVHDGFADVLIYSIDFSIRWGFDFGLIMIDVAKKLKEEIVSSPRVNMQSYYGRLCHCCLKTAQGIRGFEVQKFSLTEIGKALVDLLWSVIVLALPIQSKAPSVENVLEQLTQTWTKIVSKRDWVAKPQG